MLFRSKTMAPLLEKFNQANPSFVLKYEEKDKDTFNQDLLEAIASKRGPDMFLLTQDFAYNYTNKIVPIPYKTLSLADFRNTFASAGEVFLSNNGILAIPLVIDPILLYYNRSMLDAAGITNPPSTWEDFITDTGKLTIKDEQGKILKSGAGLGHYTNVVHAKDILAMLFMQTGNKIVSTASGLSPTSVLGDTVNGVDPATVLQFYSDFANPLKQSYAWNKSFPDSRSAFASEDLAFYFGYASELGSLINQNPNQNFSVAMVPQIRGANFKLTSARVTGVAISSFSQNLNTAYIAAMNMASQDFAVGLAQALSIAPAKRGLLSQKQTDAFLPVVYSSALVAQSWLDPSASNTESIFRGMIEGVVTNTKTPREAVQDADTRLQLLLSK